MKMKKKLLSGYLLISLLAAIIGIFCIHTYRHIETEFSSLSSKSIPAIITFTDLKTAVLHIISSASQFGFLYNESSFANTNSNNVSHQEELDELNSFGFDAYQTALQQLYRLKAHDSQLTHHLNDISTQGDRIIDISNTLITLKKQNVQGEQILNKREQLEIAEHMLLSLIDDAIMMETEQFKTRKATTSIAINNAINSIMLFLILVIGCACLIGLYTAQRITTPLNKLRQHAINLGQGKLGSRIEISNHDELGELAQGFNHMADQLQTSNHQLEEKASQLSQLNTQLIQEINERQEIQQQKLRIEKELSHSQKMQALGTLAGGVAHDFNNILSILLGNLELAKIDINKDHPAFGALEEAREATLRGKELVQQIMLFSRQQDASLTPIHLEELLQESVKLLRSILPSTIVIQLQTRPISHMIAANSGQLQQVMLNLCNNASQAMEQSGGSLLIELQEVNLTELEVRYYPGIHPGIHLKLTITDSGHGIEPEDMPRIFEPFFTTKKEGNGSGLGLTVAHGIIKKHNGHILVNSTLGQGATFELLFPCITSQWEKPTMVLETILPSSLQKRQARR